MSERQIINTKNAPAAIGPYSQAVRAGNTLYISGQLGMDPATGQIVTGGIAEETKQALENIKAILAAADFTTENVTQVQVFLADMADFSAMNEVYAEYFPASPPARAAIQVAALPKNGRIEVMVTALK